MRALIKILWAVCLLIQGVSFAQSISNEVISSSGITSNDQFYWSAGELAVNFTSSTNGEINAGLHQVYTQVPAERPLNVEDDFTSLKGPFPNPTNGMTNVIFSSPQDGYIRIIEVTGSIAVQIKLKKEINVSIDLGGLTSGSYIIKIQTEEISSTKKLIIL